MIVEVLFAGAWQYACPARDAGDVPLTILRGAYPWRVLDASGLAVRECHGRP